MTMTEKATPIIDPIDRRIYKRLPTCYRVDFQIVRLHGDLPGIDWQAGACEDLSRGGLCLYTKALDYHVFKYLKNNNIYLDLRIFVPLIPAPIKAVGELSWFKEERGTYLVGLQWKSITRLNLNLMIGESRILDWIITLALASSTLLFISLIFWRMWQQL